MLSGFKRKLCIVTAVLILSMGLPALAFAGFANAKVKIDDTRWFRVGLGFRSSVAVVEDGAPNGTSSAVGAVFDNIRLYTAARVTDHVTLEFNTEYGGRGAVTAATAQRGCQDQRRQPG